MPTQQQPKITIIIANEPRLKYDMVLMDTHWMQRLGTNLWVDLRMNQDTRPVPPAELLDYINDFPQEFYYVKMFGDGKAKILPLEECELPWAQ